MLQSRNLVLFKQNFDPLGWGRPSGVGPWGYTIRGWTPGERFLLRKHTLSPEILSYYYIVSNLSKQYFCPLGVYPNGWGPGLVPNTRTPPLGVDPRWGGPPGPYFSIENIHMYEMCPQSGSHTIYYIGILYRYHLYNKYNLKFRTFHAPPLHKSKKIKSHPRCIFLPSFVRRPPQAPPKSHLGSYRNFYLIKLVIFVKFELYHTIFNSKNIILISI